MEREEFDVMCKEIAEVLDKHDCQGSCIRMALLAVINDYGKMSSTLYTLKEHRKLNIDDIGDKPVYC